MITYNTTLEKLDLHYNNIQRSGAVAVWDALGVNSSIVQLDMSWNSLGHNDDVAMSIAHTVESNTALLHLDLS
jgi:hypothetical protein